MDAAEKRQNDLDLLRKSRQALDEGELVDRNAGPSDEAEPAPALTIGDPDVIMYRGRLVRAKKASGTPGALGTPGASSRRRRGSQFRGVAVPPSGAKVEHDR